MPGTEPTSSASEQRDVEVTNAGVGEPLRLLSAARRRRCRCPDDPRNWQRRMEQQGGDAYGACADR